MLHLLLQLILLFNSHSEVDQIVQVLKSLNVALGYGEVHLIQEGLRRGELLLRWVLLQNMLDVPAHERENHRKLFLSILYISERVFLHIF